MVGGGRSRRRRRSGDGRCCRDTDRRVLAGPARRLGRRTAATDLCYEWARPRLALFAREADEKLVPSPSNHFGRERFTGWARHPSLRHSSQEWLPRGDTAFPIGDGEDRPPVPEQPVMNRTVSLGADLSGRPALGCLLACHAHSVVWIGANEIALLSRIAGEQCQPLPPGGRDLPSNIRNVIRRMLPPVVGRPLAGRWPSVCRPLAEKGKSIHQCTCRAQEAGSGSKFAQSRHHSRRAIPGSR